MGMNQLVELSHGNISYAGKNKLVQVRKKKISKIYVNATWTLWSGWEVTN
jgi:hypothetical protein